MWNRKEFGLGMVNVKDDDLTSIHKVTITYFGKLNPHIGYRAKAVLGAAPKSLWKSEEANYSQKSVVEDVLLGFEITPVPPDPEATTPVDRKNLAWASSDFQRQLRPAGAVPIAVPPALPPDARMAELCKSINDSTVAKTRNMILENLKKRNIAVNTQVSVAELEKSKGNFLLAAPVLAYSYWKDENKKSA